VEIADFARELYPAFLVEDSSLGSSPAQ